MTALYLLLDNIHFIYGKIMTLLKSFSLIILSLFIVNTATADEKKPTKQANEQKQTVQKKATDKQSTQKKATEKKTTQKKNADKQKTQKKATEKQSSIPKTDEQINNENLKLFNNTVSIRLVSGQIINNNAPALQLIYTIENKDKKKSMSSITWVGAFAYNEQVFFSQEMPVKFNTPLEPHKKIDITITYPFEQISENAQMIFLNQQQKIQTVYGAKNITFTNGTKIDVK